MSRSQHTPGPWRIGPNPYNDREALIPIVDKDGEPVLTVFSPHKSASISVSDADLRLMVAAPDLLEALRQLLDEVREWNVVLTDATAAKQRAVLELADAAIARAEGRAP